jgi:hypothetical protein
MSEAASRHADLARRILDHEGGASLEPAANALELACGRLNFHLAELLGAGGVAALTKRALHLAQREQPVLATVDLTVGSAACFSNLAQSLADCSDEEAFAAATAVLAHIIALLIMLLGEELGTRPIQKLWPNVTSAGENEE